MSFVEPLEKYLKVKLDPESIDMICRNAPSVDFLPLPPLRFDDATVTVVSSCSPVASEGLQKLVSSYCIKALRSSIATYPESAIAGCLPLLRRERALAGAGVGVGSGSWIFCLFERRVDVDEPC